MTNQVLFNTIVTPMRTLGSIILAGIIGLVIGGASSSLVIGIKGPVFHWEMAGAYMFIISAFVGAIAGAISAAVCALAVVAGRILTKMCVGSCLGTGLGWAIGHSVVAHSSAQSPKAPEALAFWAVAVVVIGGGLAGMVGGLIANTSNPNKCLHR